MKHLTQKQENFVRVYLETGNASRAYRESYKADKMSENAIRVEASRMLDNPNISLTVEMANKKATEKVIKKLEVTKEWIIEQLVDIVILGKAGDSEDAKANLSASNKALELLGKEKGMFIDRKEVRMGALDGINHDELKELRTVIGEIITVQSTDIKRLTH